MAETPLTYPETGITKAADIAPAISIDYVNQFTEGVQQLQKLLGIARLMPIAAGATVKTYKYTTDIKKGNVAEGEYIPLSSVKKTLDQTYEIALNKWRRNTTAEAIQSRGSTAAINDTDNKFLGAIQKIVKDDLLEAITKTSKTAPAGVGLQASLANMWGALTTVFEGYEGFDTGEDEAKFIFFVNPTDVSEHLGKASITTQNAFGMKYIKDFLGLGDVITTAKVTKGSVFGTASQNINIVYTPANGSDLARTFGLTSDATGLLGMTHSTVTTDATIDTLVMSGIKIFPEISDAVLKGTISPSA